MRADQKIPISLMGLCVLYRRDPLTPLTVSSQYFHGTNGDNILNIIEKGQLFQIIFLGRYSWESRMMHGRRGLWGARLYKRHKQVVFYPTTRSLGSIHHD